MTQTQEKKLLALDIIVGKEVNTHILKHSDSKETYNDMVNENQKLTLGQFKLLKEFIYETI